jgi:hypothetical protein
MPRRADAGSPPLKLLLPPSPSRSPAHLRRAPTARPHLQLARADLLAQVLNGKDHHVTAAKTHNAVAAHERVHSQGCGRPAQRGSRSMRSPLHWLRVCRQAPEAAVPAPPPFMSIVINLTAPYHGPRSSSLTRSGPPLSPRCKSLQSALLHCRRHTDYSANGVGAWWLCTGQFSIICRGLGAEGALAAPAQPNNHVQPEGATMPLNQSWSCMRSAGQGGRGRAGQGSKQLNTS